jgi:hypothetical protein
MSSAYLTFFSCLAASNLQSHVTVISNKITDGLKHSTTETQSADASMRNNISLKICLTSRKIQLTSYLKKKLQSHFRNIFSLKSYFSFQISICLSRHFIFNKNFELAKMFFFYLHYNYWGQNEDRHFSLWHSSVCVEINCLRKYCIYV